MYGHRRWQERGDKGLMKIESPIKVLDGIAFRAAKGTGLDKIENHLADIPGTLHPPVFEDGDSHRTELAESLKPEALEQFPSRHMG